MLQTVILDARARWLRIAHVIGQTTAIPLFIAGVSWVSRGDWVLLGAAFVLASLAMAVAVLRRPLGWTVSYKGHQIRFFNHPIFGERLYIDGVLVDSGRVGFNVTLRGTIESGAGAGERITAEVRCSFVRLECRL